MLQSNLQLDNEVKSDLFNDTAFLFYSFRRSSSVMAYAMPAEGELAEGQERPPWGVSPGEAIGHRSFGAQ